MAKKTTQPIICEVTIMGACDMLFHRWNAEEVDNKANAVRGSVEKKTDNIESFVYRNDKNEICLPGEYLRMSVLKAAKYKKDPRNPRKSAMDIFKAGVVCLTNLASLGKKTWDAVDKRRVVVQRAGINRHRPLIKAGWKATVEMMILTPEYISADDLEDAISTAGMLVGVGDFIPTYGRFNIVEFKVK